VLETSAGTAEPYVQDIHAQPEALERLLEHGLEAEVRSALRRLPTFDRVVLTGMGASLFALRPAHLRLAAAGVPVWVEETAELLGEAGGLLGPRTALWVVSQSGSSAEVAALVEAVRARGAGRPYVLGFTNDPTGALAAGADAVQPIHSGPEHTVGTRSYVNSLAALATAVASALDPREDASDDPAGGRAAFAAAPDALRHHLAGWDDRLAELDAAAASGPVFVLGRGASMAAARTGALVVKEAARFPAEGMSVPQFRHGPLELVDETTTLVVLAGALRDRDRNAALARDAADAGGRVLWLDPDRRGDPPPGCLALAAPAATDDADRPVAEILPLQLLSVVLARRRGHVPGTFTRITKVTSTL
jgi:glucosamine--fructose-6-phosphate aminotransferase (isomerizing)